MKQNSEIYGLTGEEAHRLRENGCGNTPPPPIIKPAKQIIREDICTLFNLFNFLIAVVLALVGAVHSDHRSQHRNRDRPGASRQKAGGTDRRRSQGKRRSSDKPYWAAYASGIIATTRERLRKGGRPVRDRPPCYFVDMHLLSHIRSKNCS